MERDLAERIVKRVMELSPTLNALDKLSTQISDDNRAHEFRRALGELMASSAALMLPVVRQFPDLDPNREAAP